jgi:lipoprotein
MKKVLTGAAVLMAVIAMAGCSSGNKNAQSSSGSANTAMSESQAGAAQSADANQMSSQAANQESKVDGTVKTYTNSSMPELELIVTYKDDTVLTISQKQILTGYDSLGATNKEDAQKAAQQMNEAGKNQAAEGVSTNFEVTDTGVISSTTFDISKITVDPSGTLSDLGFNPDSNSFKALDANLLSAGYTAK